MANRSDHEELLIERHLPASPEAVFGIWADREKLLHWRGPKDFTCTQFDLDFRTGGDWRACIVAAAHGESWMRGRYREIVPGERLVFSFMWEDGPDQPGIETLVTVTFEAEGKGTRQLFHQAPFLARASRDSHIGGWNECFDREVHYISRLRERSMP
jgi:uncharacterized protein YndB with AHSA1/START domain